MQWAIRRTISVAKSFVSFVTCAVWWDWREVRGSHDEITAVAGPALLAVRSAQTTTVERGPN